MKSLLNLSPLIILTLFTLTSCELVGDIFKAGFNTAIFVVILVIVLILFFVFRSRRK